MAQAPGGGSASLALALSAGVVTAFNPCGFAMLPAYVSYFVGAADPDGGASLGGRLLRAARVGALVALGFVTVFGLVGIVAESLLSNINDVVPYVSMVVGAVLLLLGVAMVRGFEPKLRLPGIGRAVGGSSSRAMYLYGISYALVSVSCGFAGFSTAVVTAFREDSLVAGVGVYLAFAIGMALVLVTLSFSVALAQQAVVRGMRRLLPYVNRVSGALLAVSGLYVGYYGWFEWQTLVRNGSAPEGPVSWVTDWSAAAYRWVDAIPTSALAAAVVVVGGVVALSAVLAADARSRSR